MLDLHIRNVIGHVPVDKLDNRLIARSVKSMIAKDKAPKAIHNLRDLISAAMCLTHGEFRLIMEGGP